MMWFSEVTEWPSRPQERENRMIKAKVELRRELKSQLKSQFKGSVLGAVTSEPHHGRVSLCIGSNTCTFLESDVPEIKAALDEIVAEGAKYMGGKSTRDLVLEYAAREISGFTTANVSEHLNGALTSEEIFEILDAAGYTQARQSHGALTFFVWSPPKGGAK